MFTYLPFFLAASLDSSLIISSWLLAPPPVGEVSQSLDDIL